MAERTVRLPLATARWLTPARVALPIVLLAVGIVASPPPCAHDGCHPNLPIFVCCLALAVLTGLIVALAVRTRSPIAALFVCVGLGGALGMGAEVAQPVLVPLLDRLQEFSGIERFYDELVGPVPGLFLGGLSAVIAVGLAQIHATPSGDATDRALGLAGPWLALAGLARVAAQQERALHTSAVLLVVLGAWLLGIAAARDLARWRWIARLGADTDPRWRVAPRSHEPDEDALVPLFHVRGCIHDGVLVLRERTHDSPFRAATHSVPVALLPCDLRDALRTLAGRAARSVAVLCAQLAALFVLVLRR